MMHSGAALLALGVVLAAACGRVQDDDSSASNCETERCPAEGVVGGGKATGGGGATNGGASNGAANAGESGAGVGGLLLGVAGEDDVESGGAAESGSAGSAGALPSESRAWGVSQSASHEQMGDALADGAQQLAVAGDDSAFTIWKSNVPGFPVYVSRYAPGGAWSEPAQLDANSGDRGDAVIAAEHDGDAIAAWLRVTAAGSEIRAARFHAGWQPSQAISALTDDVVPGIRIVSNPNGAYFVAWGQSAVPEGPPHAQIAHYIHDLGWQPLWAPSCAVEADQTAFLPRGQLLASINPRGDALFSWFGTYTGGSLATDLLAQRYLADGGFQACEMPAQNLRGPAVSGAQALDDAGHGLVTWNQGTDHSDAPDAEIDASTFNGAWSTPATIAGFGEGPVLAASDAAGHFLVVWADNLYIGSVFASTSLLGEAWSFETSPDDGPQGPLRTSNAFAPVLSMSRSGTALLAWERGPPTNGATSSMYATSFRFETGFAPQTLISEGQVRDYVSVVSDPEGNGMLLWRSGRAAGMPLLQAARYRPRTGWTLPAVDVASEAGDLPIMAAGESGEVVAVWYGAYPYAAGATVFR